MDKQKGFLNRKIGYQLSSIKYQNKTPKHIIHFPMNFIVNTIPAKASFIQKPSESDTLKYSA